MIYKNNNAGFTMIEMLIAITIFTLITIYTFSTYVYYNKKAILHDGVKEVSQSLYEARNYAINGLNTNSQNKSVGLYFDSSVNELKYYSYDYTLSGSEIKLDTTIPGIELFKTKTLNSNFYIENILGENNAMFLFNSISGKGEYFYYDHFNNRVPFLSNKIDLKVSFKHSTSSLLNRTISYFTDTYITDY